MKINYIQISNILSFKFHNEIENAEKITFDENLNILIGENGSGKSTVLEVINFIFKKVIFLPVEIQHDQLKNREGLISSQRSKILSRIEDRRYDGFRLEPNWSDDEQKQQVRIEIKLDAIDLANSELLLKHADKINRVKQLYSEIKMDIPAVRQDIIQIDITFNSAEKNFRITHSKSIPEIFNYLENYILFQELIKLHNLDDLESKIPQLRESFVLIGAYRNYHRFVPNVSLQVAANDQIKTIRQAESSRSINAGEQSEPSIFNLVRLVIAEEHYQIFETKDLKQSDLEANKFPLIVSINKKLEMINLECKITLKDRRSWSYSFEFFDKKRNKAITDINSLSAGQKAIVHLIFESYGRGHLKGGVVIIDEPEIHLHHQFQNEYLHILKELNKEQQCQYIIVTHSETFITSETINNVRRFYLDNVNYSHSIMPKLEPDRLPLIRILDNTRSTYAFFSKKIILVEGDIDRYFFKAVLQILKPELVQEIAILDIGGKGNYQKWKDFFKSYGLNCYYICDADNVFEQVPSLDKGAMKKRKIEIEDELKQDRLDSLSDQQRARLQKVFDELVATPDFIENPKRQPWKALCDVFIELVSIQEKQIFIQLKLENKELKKSISDRYSDGVFILQEGDLESYIPIPKKGLKETIDFCENGLREWLAEKSIESEEICSIINYIVSNAVVVADVEDGV